MKRHTIIFSIICTLIAGLSCSDWGTREIFEGSALGVVPDSTTNTKVFDLPAEESKLHINVIANQEYSIHPEAEWISTPATSKAKDGFELTCMANNGPARSTKILLAIEHAEHYDTLTIRQKGGIEPQITFSNHNIELNGSTEGQANISTLTNVPTEEVVYDIEYLSSSTDWISNLILTAENLQFDYSANSTESRRSAKIQLHFTDGWGETITSTLYVIQLNSSDSKGLLISIADLKSLANESGIEISSDLMIEGIVVSSLTSGNTGDNTQVDESTIDYSICDRTIYLESLDGTHGIKLETKSAKDNTFNQGDKIKLCISEATLYKSEVSHIDDPVYYYLTGIHAGMVTEYSPGSKENIPFKEKTIGTLTDDDIFTYVTLSNCELPVRKGSLTPVNETFTNVFLSDKCAKFPVLLRDIDGNSLYVYTNTTCPYRRDGSILPYGSGTMSGVIVHEHYTRFVFQDTDSISEDTYGNIGRYQIRHTSKEDFGMAATMEESSFSKILCEWRYVLGNYQEQYGATDGDLSAYFTSTFRYDAKNETYIKDGRAGKLAYTTYSDYSYLGPMDVIGNLNGVGVTTSNGIYWMGPDFNGENSKYATTINSNGNGQVQAGAGSGWCTNITRFNKVPQAMKIVFSTKDINTSELSLQITMMNDYQQESSKIPGPRVWHLEYSLTDQNDSWHRLETFLVPDYLQSVIPQVWQTAGFKPMNFSLPTELCNKETVYLRIIPDASLAAGSRSMYIDPASTTTTNGSYRTCWNYIGIRYNK